MYRLIGMLVLFVIKWVCWVLDFVDIFYYFEEYLLQIIIFWVCLCSGQFSGFVLVLVLLGKGGIKLLDFWDIVLCVYYDWFQVGLIFDVYREVVVQMNIFSEQIFYVGCILVLDCVLVDNYVLLDLFFLLILGWCWRLMLLVMCNIIGVI